MRTRTGKIQMYIYIQKTFKNNGFGWSQTERQDNLRNYKFRKEMDFFHERFNQKTNLTDFIYDNLLKLTLFTAMERNAVYNQAYPYIQNHKVNFSGFRGAMDAIMNMGIFRGSCKGIGTHFVYNLGVYFPVLHFGFKKNFFEQSLILSASEAVFYPLDKIRSVLYTDLYNTKHYFQVWNECWSRNIWKTYNGIQYKLIYNLLLLNICHQQINGDGLIYYISMAAWAASFKLLTLKTRVQVKDHFTWHDVKAFNNYYRGLVPWFVANMIVGWTFYGFYGREKQRQVIADIFERCEFANTNPFKRIE